MKRILLTVLVLMIISLAACGSKQVEIEQPLAPSDDKSQATFDETPETGDAAVDSVGNDIDDMSLVEEDLDLEELSDLDSVLDDIEDI